MKDISINSVSNGESGSKSKPEKMRRHLKTNLKILKNESIPEMTQENNQTPLPPSMRNVLAIEKIQISQKSASIDLPTDRTSPEKS
jgi:hypothetical protein